MRGYLLHIHVFLMFYISFQEISTPDQLYEEVIEVEGRLVLQQDSCEIKQKCPVVEGKTKEKVGNFFWSLLNEVLYV